MIELEQIDERIRLLLDYLQSIQNEDGGFDRMRIQPNSDQPKKWELHQRSTSYDTAVPLIPLLFMSSDQTKSVLNRGVNCIKENSLDNFLWTWPGPHPVPYCTDDTSICSYVLSKSGVAVRNDRFLNEQIDHRQYYRFFIWPLSKSDSISFFTYLKLKWRNRKVKHSQHFSLNEIQLDDSEFTSTCVNLLYLGKTESNKRVWQNLIEKFNNKSFDFIYYMNSCHAVYCFSRLFGYENNKDANVNYDVVNQLIFELYRSCNEVSLSPLKVLVMNSALFFDLDLEKYSDLVTACFRDIDLEYYKLCSAYYSSHIPTIERPKEDIYYTCYGSSAITCSLYLEFLNLYRKRYYKSYFGMG